MIVQNVTIFPALRRPLSTLRQTARRAAHLTSEHAADPLFALLGDADFAEDFGFIVQQLAQPHDRR